MNNACHCLILVCFPKYKALAFLRNSMFLRGICHLLYSLYSKGKFDKFCRFERVKHCVSSSLAGWNGKHCSLEGCPGNCHGHGQCKTATGMSNGGGGGSGGGDWECWCESGWYGRGCEVEMERDCSDKRDNDGGETIFEQGNKLPPWHILTRTKLFKKMRTKKFIFWSSSPPPPK